jgi:hypothetical protein
MHIRSMQKQTSLRVSKDLLKVLKSFQEKGESYEDIIWDFIEPHLELSEQTKKDIQKSRQEYKKGNFFTLEEVKKEFGF